MFLTAHATAQQQGGRTAQCDATAVAAAPGGIVAFAVLDGIGSNSEVRAWTRLAAGRVARAALHDRSAEGGLRRVYDRYAAAGCDFTEDGDQIGAAALVALLIPGEPLELAWCGDVRAYAVRDDEVEQLTRDHNLRRVRIDQGLRYSQYDRNLLTSCLGSDETDVDVRFKAGHPAIETATVPVEELRLVLATDGAYEPIEDFGSHLADYLTGIPAEAAEDFTETAVARARTVKEPKHVDNATVRIVDLVP
ncbi:PP2C family protein-serine/threonine phosphatase [Streptomyces sp. NPDC088847]|uniref:PP2C family protein-serine/threonine phosphatase n=1 Tax=Streptomyces sp. NPDC088847 TaxID=3365909 RepID=UPI00380C710D